MGKIFKQLARHWAACLAVVALLFVQAYCDLSLPDYTSKIVDTGIQQGGIESPLPQTLRSSTLDALSLLMREEDAAAFENAYEYYVQDDGVLKLRRDLPAARADLLLHGEREVDVVLRFFHVHHRRQQHIAADAVVDGLCGDVARRKLRVRALIACNVADINVF